ncbi:MAG TPA: hypothetical protein ENN87_06565, partial [Phycisphaerales bacterium]|nr:hypothetical protein [Phycisphaerales bacterium]
PRLRRVLYDSGWRGLRDQPRLARYDGLTVDVRPPALPTSRTRVRLLGRPGTLPWGHDNGRVRIDLSDVTVDQLPCEHAFVFKLTGFDS